MQYLRLAVSLAIVLAAVAVAHPSHSSVHSEFDLEHLAGFSCRTEENPTGPRIIVRLQSETEAEISIYENFVLIASISTRADLSTLAMGDLVFSSESFGLVINPRPTERNVLNGEKIKLYPADFLAVLKGGRSMNGATTCVVLRK